MRRMTCRPRLRQRLQAPPERFAQASRRGENGFVFVAAICMGLMVTSARGGTNLFPSAGPTNPASAMWTLNDIYNVLDTRTTNVTKRTGGFNEPSGGPTNGTMRTLNDIMTLVTNRAPAPKTGQTISQAMGDDGWYSTNLGVAWPNPRFTIGTGTDGTNCVTDNLTGLIWTRNANMPGGMKDWTNAISFCTNMNNGVGTYGYTDWRLPNCRELFSLIDIRWVDPALCNTAGTAQMLTPGEPFTGVQNIQYWTSSTEPVHPQYSWYIGMGADTVNLWSSMKTNTYYVWPVRGGR